VHHASPSHACGLCVCVRGGSTSPRSPPLYVHSRTSKKIYISCLLRRTCARRRARGRSTRCVRRMFARPEPTGMRADCMWLHARAPHMALGAPVRAARFLNVDRCASLSLSVALALSVSFSLFLSLSLYLSIYLCIDLSLPPPTPPQTPPLQTPPPSLASLSLSLFVCTDMGAGRKGAAGGPRSQAQEAALRRRTGPVRATASIPKTKSLQIWTSWAPRACACLFFLVSAQGHAVSRGGSSCVHVYVCACVCVRTLIHTLPQQTTLILTLPQHTTSIYTPQHIQSSVP
jgi:hypothetical protein